jgi:hypothetical protein
MENSMASKTCGQKWVLECRVKHQYNYRNQIHVRYNPAFQLFAPPRPDTLGKSKERMRFQSACNIDHKLHQTESTGSTEIRGTETFIVCLELQLW